MSIISTTSALMGNTITHTIGQIFQPIFRLFAMVLAAIYSVIPNYAIAITILTIIIMGALTPLTVKSTKSMIAMQRLQPEIKKLQQKYKGAENRQQLNEEMMRLYKEEKVNPAGGCLPMFIQFPFLIVLYDIIRGLTNTITTKVTIPASCHIDAATLHAPYASPRYIPDTSKMYCDLVAHGGQMKSFGIDLALKPFSHHASVWAALPYFILVGLAVLLQYIQMSQMNKRNAASQQNSSMMKIQKFMPIMFAYIYFLIPAAVLVYMVVSTVIRIITQDVIFRTGMVTPVGATPKVIPRNDAEKSSNKELPSASEGGSTGQTAPKPVANPGTRSKKKRKRKDR
jgi:YidC/Oxa1 family membrane protein insertase